MFLSNSLFQFVFADEGDTYYCDSLMELDLNRYLWLELHEKYDFVYFLTPQNSAVSVFDCGDAGIKRYNRRGFGRKRSEAKRFCGWMKERLNDKERKCAFVCTFRDFSAIFADADWQEALKTAVVSGKRTGTIVLTMSPVVERSHISLLKSSIFEALGDKAVAGARKDSFHDYYGMLKKSMGESCVFLNAFTREKIHSLLIHVIFRQKERFTEECRLERMADYAAQYLNNRQLQWSDTLFNSDFDPVNPLYSDIFSQMLNKNVWNRLLSLAEQIQRAGGICPYLAEKGIDPVDDVSASVRISYERGSAAWKCMRLNPADVMPRNEAPDSNIEKMIVDIFQKLSTPENHALNKLVEEAADDFLRRMENARNIRDGETCRRILYSIWFCVDSLYAQEESIKDVLRIIDVLKHYVSFSEDVFMLSCAERKAGLKAAVAQYAAKRIAKETLLNQCEAVVRTSIAGLSVSRSDPEEIQRISGEMAGMLKELEEQDTAVPDLHTDDFHEPEAALVQNDDDDFYFSSSLEEFRIPPIH